MKKALVFILSMAFLLAGCSNVGKTIQVDLQSELPMITEIGTAMWSFIDSKGELYTWGFDSYNAGTRTQYYLGTSLGQGTEVIYSNMPTNIYSNTTYCVLGNRGLTSDGEIIEWGKLIKDDPCVPCVAETNVAKTDINLFLTKTGELYIMPPEENSLLNKSYHESRELIMTEVRDFAIGYTYFALKNDGSVWEFLINSMVGTIVQKPRKIIDDVKRIIVAHASSETATLFLKNDGTLWSYGNNEFGQCGNGEHGDLSVKTQDCVVTNPYKMAENVIEAWASFSTTFYLTEDYKLYACGKNYNDILLTGGDGKMNRYDYPDVIAKPVLLMENVRQVEYSDMGMFVLKVDNTLWSWGYADKGTLGNGIYYEGDDLRESHFTERMLQTGEALFSQPVQIMENVDRIFTETTGLHFAQKTDGTLWYWGYGGIYVDEEDNWDTEEMKDNDVSVFIKHYIIPTPIEFSVETFFQNALDSIAAREGIDTTQYQAMRYR